MPLRFLVVASETPDQRNERRRAAGAASDETYAQTLAEIEPGCACDLVSCVDGTPAPSCEALRRYDAMFFAGSPIAMHEDNAATRSATTFMRAMFRSGVPAFGSCAGLQIAAVAAGGRARVRQPRLEAGFARRTEASRAAPDRCDVGPSARGRVPRPAFLLEPPRRGRFPRHGRLQVPVQHPAGTSGDRPPF